MSKIIWFKYLFLVLVVCVSCTVENSEPEANKQSVPVAKKQSVAASENMSISPIKSSPLPTSTLVPTSTFTPLPPSPAFTAIPTVTPIPQPPTTQNWRSVTHSSGVSIDYPSEWVAEITANNDIKFSLPNI